MINARPGYLLVKLSPAIVQVLNAMCAPSDAPPPWRPEPTPPTPNDDLSLRRAEREFLRS